MIPDQACTLRRLASVTRPSFPEHNRLSLVKQHHADKRTKVLSFTSGKGGVGKTHIVVNLAYALRQLGVKVMILDADLGLANVDVLLGLAPRFTIQHVLSGEKRLEEILVEGPAGIVIMPASSGVQELVDLTDGQRLQLLSDLDGLERVIDVLLVDTGAGISANVMYFNMAAQGIVVVVTPEPTSLTDAYALMKVLSTKYAENHFKIILNAVKNDKEATETFRRLSTVAERFLNISLDYLGYILQDAAFPQAVRQQKAVMEVYPGSPAAQCIRSLARRIQELPEVVHPKGNIQFFWKRLLTRQPLSSPHVPSR